MPLKAVSSNAGGSSGTNATVTGTPISGELVKFSGGASITNGNLSGDVTTSDSLVTTVAKIAGTTVSGTTGTGNSVFSASPTFTGTAVIAASTVTGIQNMSTGVIEQTVFDNGNSGTSKNITWDNGNLQKVTITGAVTFTFTAPTNPGGFTLLITQDGSGHIYSFPTIIYPNGIAPTWSTAASKKDVLSVIYDGAIYWGVSLIAFA